MSALDHQILGEHVYDGIYMCGVFPRPVLDRIRGGDFQPDEQDVMVITYPKAGNAWFQEIVWLLMNDADVETASSVQQEDRVIFLEWQDPGAKARMDVLREMQSPRVIKSHLQYYMHEHTIKDKKIKVVLGIRNLKDTLTSLYHFYCMNEGLGKFSGTFSDFFELFKANKLVFGDWFDLNLGYWENRQHLNLFLLRYEDLHKDLEGTVRKLAEFLGKSPTEEQLKAIMKHVSFESMRGNDNINKHHVGIMDQTVSPYMRKGKVGDWMNYLSAEESDYLDELCKRKLEGTGLEVDFTL